MISVSLRPTFYHDNTNESILNFKLPILKVLRGWEYERLQYYYRCYNKVVIIVIVIFKIILALLHLQGNDGENDVSNHVNEKNNIKS